MLSDILGLSFADALFIIMQESARRLHGNFIPLNRVVEAIANLISISDEETDGYRSLNDVAGADPFQASAQRSRVKAVLRSSNAAGQLLRLLNQPQPMRPSWWHVTEGYPLLDDQVHKEGMQILVNLERSSLSLLSAISPWRSISNDGAQGARIESQRDALIGFDLCEVITFLDTNGVPHMLGHEVKSEGHHGGLSLVVRSTEVVPSAKAESVRKFRGPLAEVLQVAVTKARDPGDYKSVFAALCELAQLEKPPIPLVGFNAPDREVLWHDQDPDVAETFGIDHMRSRFRPKKERRSRRSSTQSRATVHK